MLVSITVASLHGQACRGHGAAMFASRRAGRATFWYLAADRLVAAVISRTPDEPLLEACAASYAQRGPSSLFAPGIVELAWLLRAERFAHIAALAAPFCAIDPVDAGGARRGSDVAAGNAEPAMVADGFGGAEVASARKPGADERVAKIRGVQPASPGAGYSGLQVRAQLRAVSQAQALFRRARLRLLALDCEACALVTLADTLGTASPPLWPEAFSSTASGVQATAAHATAAHATASQPSPQPLAAVSVSPEAERAAHALGDDLAVPVGLALAWFGAPRAR